MTYFLIAYERELANKTDKRSPANLGISPLKKPKIPFCL